MKSKIAIVNYGVGNIFSVTKAFNRFTDSLFVTEEASEIASADAIVLPGVGAFAEGMRGLDARHLSGIIKEKALSGTPILGICLGAQILLDKGYEFGEFEGLGIIKGKVVLFPMNNTSIKIPHIGWNSIYPKKENEWNGTIFENLTSDVNMYFVHSYILLPERAENICARSLYEGYEFCSAVRMGNVYGLQFHPEKSAEAGLTIIKNFVNLVS